MLLKGIVKILLKTEGGSLSINKQDNNGRTPLSTAVGEGHVEIIQILLSTEEGMLSLNTGNNDVIRDAYILIGNATAVNLLLNATDVKQSLNTAAKGNLPPLLMSVVFNHPSIVRLLLRYKEIDVNIQDDDGMTSLIIAAKRNR